MSVHNSSDNRTPKEDLLLFTDVVDESNSYRVSQQKGISLSTHLAYNILSSKHRFLIVFIILALTSVCLAMLFSLGFSLVGRFSDAFSLARVIAQGESYIEVSQADAAFTMAWSGLIMFLVCAFVCFICVVLTIKMVRIYLAFSKRNLAVVPLEKDKRSGSS